MAYIYDDSHDYTGNPATFTDPHGTSDISGVSVPISPIQDLHGYSSPWPAGGGKNLLVPRLPSLTQAGITMTNNGDGSFNFVGTATANTNFRIDQISTDSTSNLRSYTAPFVMSMSSTATVGTLFLGGYKDGTWTTPSCPVNSNTKVTDNIDNAFAYIRFNNGDTVNATFYPQIESGSTATSWEPYENRCPISGRTGLNVYRTGKNLCYHDPNVNSNIYNGGNLIPVKAGDKVYCYGEWTYTQAANLWGGIFASQSETSKNNRKVQLGWITSGRVMEYTITVDGYFGVAYSSGVATYTIEKMMISLSPITGATDYEPYQGNTYAVDWTTEAGTVYGGTLDVVTGVLTVLYGITTFGQLNPNDTTLPNVFRFYLSGKQSGKDNFLCSAFKVVNKTSPANYEITGVENSSNVYVKDTDYSTAADFKTAFSDQQIAYELATPITYQLTAQEVQMLLGENYVWSSSGDTVSVTYYAEGNANPLQSLNILLGGNYSNPKTADDVSDKEALEIILGGNK